MSFEMILYIYIKFLKTDFKCFGVFLAPGTYDVEKSEKIIHQSSGAVTFGIKYKEKKPDDIPGNYFFPYFF